MAPAFGDAAEARFHSKLYLASKAAILEVVATTPAEVKTAMVLGHNPGIFQVALELSRRSDEDDRTALSRGMPTGTAVVIALDGDWRDAGQGGEMVKLVLPRRLENS